MMKTASMLLLCGAAAAATAGDTADVTFHFDVDGDPFGASTVEYQVGDTVTWFVYASFTGYDDMSAYFGGFVGDFNANNPDAATVQNLNVLMAGNAIEPTYDGATIQGLNIFNSALLGTDDQNNPLMILTFETVMTSDAGLNYSTDGTASVFANDGIFTLPDEFQSASIISDSLVIPAPGAAALLGLGGLAAVRRRR